LSLLILLVLGVAYIGRAIYLNPLAWRDWISALAMFVAVGGFAAMRLLPSVSGFVSLFVVIPAMMLAVGASMRTRQRAVAHLAESQARQLEEDERDARLAAEAARASDPLPGLLLESRLKDREERSALVQRRVWRMRLVLPVAMASVGILRGSWETAVMGALIGFVPVTIGALITRSKGLLSRKAKRPELIPNLADATAESRR
jgi:hypothetical protein